MHTDRYTKRATSAWPAITSIQSTTPCSSSKITEARYPIWQWRSTWIMAAMSTTWRRTLTGPPWRMQPSQVSRGGETIVSKRWPRDWWKQKTAQITSANWTWIRPGWCRVTRRASLKLTSDKAWRVCSMSMANTKAVKLKRSIEAVSIWTWVVYK